ncbi:GNAT family N-acetyltransferase [Streptomyces sp. NPDC002574]|uniref:GNAT family N-acetyltransferase n=1 Tax=Streptomyces sp. NPDC002574 TaxID=3364652 RepID=UPI003679AA59
MRGWCVAAGGDLLVAEPRVRVHPAERRHGVGRAVITPLEQRAADTAIRRPYLDPATPQQEAMAFHLSPDSQESGREHRRGRPWTSVSRVKAS